MSFYGNSSINKRIKFSNQRSFSVWREFSTQQKAFDFVESRPQRNPSGGDLKGDRKFAIFSYEINILDPGTRKFLVCSSRRDFWFEYLELPSRHYYELIRENDPCNLYFDLEFDSTLDANKQRNGEEMVQEFKSLVLVRLQLVYRVEKEAIKVVDLESLSSKKFSRHLIFKIHGWKFENNRECGLFARSLIDEQDQDTFFVMDKHGNSVPFVDLGVYSRNRNFRLLLSSKIGKDNQLNFAKTSGMPTEMSKITYEMFQETLVCDGARDIEILPALQPKLAAPTVSKIHLKHLSSKSMSLSDKHSDYPEIEIYITSLIDSHLPGSRSFVRSFISYPESKTIIFVIGGSRFCNRIGREHSSNAQFYVVDLFHGTFRQRCFDPDCRTYKGPLGKLPDYLGPFQPVNDQPLIDDDAFLFQGVDDTDLLTLDYDNDDELFDAIDDTEIINLNF